MATTVLASAATGFGEFIDRMGGDSAVILREAGLRADLPTREPNSTIFLSNYCRAMGRAAQHTGKSNLGLWFGQQFSPRSLGLWGYLGSSSPDLATALRNLTCYFPCHQRNSRLELVIRRDLCFLKYQVHESMPDERHDTELSLALLMNQLREALGREWSPEAVHFMHSKPAAWTEHRRAFNADVLFDRECNCLVFKTSDLAAPMPFQDAMLLRVMKHSLLQAGEHEMPREANVLDRAGEAIEMLLSYGDPRLGEVAKRLDMPSWTFQRRLAEEGVNFKDLVESVRIALALKLLAGKHNSISETALLLGYSEVSAFSRAFSRWFQISPRQWRENGSDPTDGTQQ